MKKISIAALVALLPFAATAFQPAGVKLPYSAAPAGISTPDAKTPRMYFHGGEVMTSASNSIFLIYYGSFPDDGSANNTRRLVNDFAAHIGGTPQYGVNSSYTDASGKHIVNALQFDPVANVYDDRYSLGKKVGFNDIPTIVRNALEAGHLPVRDDALYVVLIAPNATSKLGLACAWHNGSTEMIAGHSIKYAAIPVFGADNQFLKACSGSLGTYGESTSPNDNPEGDNALDSLMHELSEAVSDPLLTGWTARRDNQENGDLCNFIYGTTYTAPNGTHANLALAGHNYLVQNIWLRNHGESHCSDGVH